MLPSDIATGDWISRLKTPVHTAKLCARNFNGFGASDTVFVGC